MKLSLLLYSCLLLFDSLGAKDSSSELEWVIKPIFEDAIPHGPKGLAAVKYKGKWGYIDQKGKGVIKPKWDLACSFSEDLALVKRNDKWLYINRMGEEVCKPSYLIASNFHNGIAVVMTNHSVGTIDTKCQWITELKLADLKLKMYQMSRQRQGRFSIGSNDDFLIARAAHNCFVFQRDGTQPTALKKSNWNSCSYSKGQGLAVVDWPGKSGQSSRLVLLNKEKILFDSKNYGKKFLNCSFFSDGFHENVASIVAWGNDPSQQISKIAYMNVDGKMIVDFRNDNREKNALINKSRMVSNRAIFSATGSAPWGFINSKGDVVISPKWEAVSEFSKKGYAAAFRGDSAVIIDKNGNEIRTILKGLKRHPPKTITRNGIASLSPVVIDINQSDIFIFLGFTGVKSACYDYQGKMVPVWAQRPELSKDEKYYFSRKSAKKDGSLVPGVVALDRSYNELFEPLPSDSEGRSLSEFSSWKATSLKACYDRGNGYPVRDSRTNLVGYVKIPIE